MSVFDCGRVVENTLILINIMETYSPGVDYIIAKDSNIKLLLEVLYVEVSYQNYYSI